MHSTSSSRIAIALVFACGCDAGTLSAPVAVAPKPVDPIAGPQLVGADPRPEPALLVPSRAPVIGLAVGANHSCAVHDDGAVSCWGSSSHGQLGMVDPDQSALPIGVAVGDVVEISAESETTCARQRSGRIVCWGQLQGSNVDESPRATEVGDAVQLSGMCARTSTGGVRCIERGLYAVEVPIHDATTIAARDGVRGCAIATGGAVKCWGYARHGEEAALEVLPVDQVRDAVELAVGWTFACARAAGGGVSCWDFDLTSDGGVGKPHALGITDATALAASPGSLCIVRRNAPIGCVYPGLARAAPHELTELTELSGQPITALAVSSAHGCALAGGRVVCWGTNVDGEVGTGWASTTARARRVPGLDDVEQVVAAGETTCVRHRDGTVACFGELPQPPSARRPIPCARTRRDLPAPLSCTAPVPTTAAPTRVAAMPSSGLCSITDGALSCRNVPIAGTHDLIAVTTAERYTCVLGRDGTTACYQTYDGAPIAMPALDHAREIAVTLRDHEPELCALRDDHTVACVTPKAPAAVVRAIGAVALASNDKTACVVLADGRAGCWGLGSYGLLGDGRTALHDGIAYVRGLAGAVGISVGRIHACARLADGGVACWGYGAMGQTGIHVHEPIDRATRLRV
jgi:hypothetical protein